jgi:DNA polymerase III alpha subunit (gram-positive type)
MSIGSDLIRFGDRKILYFDMESQRVNCMDDNLPFQCSWVITQRGKILSEHNYYINWPNFKMSDDAAKITHFKQSWVDNGDDPEFVLDAFESYLQDELYLISGHNILAFDLMLWQLWRKALNRNVNYSILPRIIDTNILSRAYKMYWKPDRNNFIAWQYKVYNTPKKGVKTNLQQMAKEFDIVFDETKLHDAGYDLAVNNQVGWKLINLMEV